MTKIGELGHNRAFENFFQLFFLLAPIEKIMFFEKNNEIRGQTGNRQRDTWTNCPFWGFIGKS